MAKHTHGSHLGGAHAIRARQRVQTALFPHSHNSKFIIPKRVALFKVPVMGIVAAQANTQLIAITPVDMKPFLVSGVDIVWSAANLPTGLTIDAATGLVSGTAPAAAVFSTCTVTATNQFGASTSAAFTWTISV